MSRSHKSKMKPYPCNCHRPKGEALPPGDRRALAESVEELVLARDEWTAEEELAMCALEDDSANQAYEEGIFASACRAFLADRELAARFGVSRSTVERWKSGTTVPHALMRAPILAFLQREGA